MRDMNLNDLVSFECRYSSLQFELLSSVLGFLYWHKEGFKGLGFPLEDKDKYGLGETLEDKKWTLVLISLVG